jgi:hypothetical protein
MVNSLKLLVFVNDLHVADVVLGENYSNLKVAKFLEEMISNARESGNYILYMKCNIVNNSHIRKGDQVN